MSRGYIIVQVVISKSETPLESADIIIRRARDNKIVHEESLTKASKGSTNKVEVDTPDKELSQYPYLGGPLPYEPYDVYVSSKGFMDSIVLGVQVFPETTAIQKVILIPGSQGVNIIKIPPHSLVR